MTSKLYKHLNIPFIGMYMQYSVFKLNNIMLYTQRA